jgi:signal transduction histidine kinase
MRTAAVALIFASVGIRALVWYSSGPYWSLVLGLLALFSCLLFGEPFLERWLGKGEKGRLRWLQITYLLLQMSLVMALLVIPPLNDFPALLFIPLSLQAMMFYQRRTGFLWISSFTLATAAILVRGGQKVTQGLVMALLFGGCCFLAGSYAHLIRKAESARRENQRTFDELQAAHRQLQGYAFQRQELAAERERGRLARELHDSVTQTVFSMNLAVQTARFLWPSDPGRVNAQLDRFLELADSAMDEIRTLVAHLGSKTAASQGLAVAIEQLVAERQTLDGLRVRLDILGEKNLPGPVTTGLCSIVREALTNIAKHAGTQDATVRLVFTADPIYVEIEDRGIGFDIAISRNQPGHIGLAEMAERASEIGWELSLDTQLGRGTRIRVEEKKETG